MDCKLYLLVMMLLVPLRAEAQLTSVLIRPDHDAWIEIDGNSATKRLVAAWVVYEVAVTPGDHLIAASTADGLDRWETVASVADNGRTVVLVPLAEVKRNREANTTASNDATQRRVEIGQLEKRATELRRRLEQELSEAQAAVQRAHFARNSYAPSDWVRALNRLTVQLNESEALKRRGNAERLQLEIAEIERQIDRLSR